MATFAHTIPSFPETQFAGKFTRFSLCLLIIFYMVPVTVLLDPGSNVSVVSDASNILDQIISLSLFAISLVAALLSRVRFRLVIFSLLPFSFFIIWALLSISWSNFPDLTARRSIRLTIELVTFILLALSSRNDDNVLRTFYRAFFFSNLVAFASLAFPSIAFRDVEGLAFSGFYPQKNVAGLFFAIIIPIFVLGTIDRSISRNRVVAAVALISAMGMLELSQSRTARDVVIMASILSGLTCYLNLLKGYPKYILTGCCCLVLMFVLFMIAYFGVSGALDLVLKNPTFTGRDEIWNYTLYRFNNSPALLGVGYGGLWEVGNSIALSLSDFGIKYVINEAHSGYLDILAQLGYIGVGCFIIFIAISFKRILRFVFVYISQTGRTQKQICFYSLYIFYGAIIHNITETSIFLGGGMLWMVLVFFIVYCGCPMRNRMD